MNKTSVYIVAAVGYFLVGCGAQSHMVRKPSSQALSSYKVVEIKPFMVSADLMKELTPDQSAKLQGLAAMMAPKITQKLIERGFGSSSTEDTRLVVESLVVSHDPGSQALRYFVGFGAGSSKTTTQVQFKNSGGDVIGIADFVAGVSAGMFGGSEDTAVERLANEIADYIVKDKVFKAQ